MQNNQMMIDLIMCLSGANNQTSLGHLTVRYYGKKATRPVVYAKKLAAYLLRMEAGLKYKDIGPMLAFDTHVSAVRGANEYIHLQHVDPAINAEIAAATLSLSKINQL